jgi:hypothetical protein
LPAQRGQGALGQDPRRQAPGLPPRRGQPRAGGSPPQDDEHSAAHDHHDSAAHDHDHSAAADHRHDAAAHDHHDSAAADDHDHSSSSSAAVRRELVRCGYVRPVDGWRNPERGLDDAGA